MTTASIKSYDRMIAGAINYARADKSDPFSLRRAISHIKNGVASLNNDKQQVAYYDAEEYSEPREYVHEGRIIKYSVPAWKGMIRP